MCEKLDGSKEFLINRCLSIRGGGSLPGSTRKAGSWGYSSELFGGESRGLGQDKGSQFSASWCNRERSKNRTGGLASKPGERE
jgi:hypothetical protein